MNASAPGATERSRVLSADPRASFEASWPLIESVNGYLAKGEAAALHALAGRVAPPRWIVEIGTYCGRSTAASATGKQSGVPLLTIDPYGGADAATAPAAMREFCENMDRVGAGHEVQQFWGTSEEAARSRALVFATAAARARTLGASQDVADVDVALATQARAGPPPCERRAFRIETSTASTWVDDGATPARDPEIGMLFIDGLHDKASVLLDIDLWEPFVAEGGAVVFHDAFFRSGVTRALFTRHLLNSEFQYERSMVNTSMFRRRSRLDSWAVLDSGLRMTARIPHYAANKVTSLGVRHNWPWLLRFFPPSPDFEYY